MKISKFRSIKYEMVWRVAIPIVLIFIGTVLFLYQLFENSSAESVNNQLMFQAESITTTAEEFFKLNAVTTEQLSGDPVTKAVMRQCEQGVYICDTPQYPTLMQSLKNCDATQGDTYIQSYIANWNANDLATSAGDNSHIDWPGFVASERGWAIDTMNSGGKTIFTAPYVDTASGKMCCTISSPITDESGKCIGAAAADIEMTKLQELFANADITGEHGFAVVFLPDNTTFYHPYEDMVGLDIHDLGLNEEVINAVLDKDTGTVIEYDAMGTSWIGTITEIENTGWVIATSTVKAEAYHTVINSIMMLIAALLIVLILIVLVLMAVAKNIGGPIMKLADIAHQMAVGDLSFELEREEKVRDEIDILVNAVVDMAENSKEQAASLQKLAMGDANLEVIPKSENDIVNISLAKVVATLKELLSETTMLTQESIAGNTGVRGDANKFSGGYKAIIAGVNNTLDAIMAEVGNMSDVVTALGQGQLPEIENNAKGDYAVITDNLINTVGAIKALVDDTRGMASAAIDGDYSVRADAEKYNGEYKNVIEGINATLDMVVAKTAWFEAIIDSIPEPVQVMDNEKKWTLVNKAFAAPYIEMGMIKKAADFYGKPCHMDGMNICGVDALVNEGKAEMQMNYGNEIYRQTTGVLKDQKGNAIGYVGTIQDLTAITKQAEYSDAAAARLERNLANLANGVFEFEPNEIPRNEYTKDLEVTFDAIDSAVESVTEAVDLLVTDSVKLAGYAVSGQLDKRAPLDKYKGEYAKVMKGMNDTVDALTAPINELINVLEAVGNGDLSKEVYGDYQGDLVKSKNALNETVYTLRAVIEDIKSVLAAIGSGDLTVQISDNYKGDFIAIKESFLEIIDNLTDVMGNINESSAQVAAGSKQLSDGAQTLANGSTKQAAAVQQLSMTIGKVAEQTRRNTEDAKKASTLSTDVMHMAEKGNVQMKDMLVSMEEINESSANISKIIKVIDDIAFQTNILALNAAVEAARAGVHGKGFAVVADEVRNLAAKSAEAAAETTSLIEGSVSKVNAGTQIANATAEALEAIVSGITETSNLCDAIAVVSEEQTAGIDEVNTGIEQVSEVIQSNSATAQQSAASSEELYGQADMLKKQVAQFKLKGSKNVHAAIPAPAARPAKEDTPVMITLDDFGGSDKY